MKSSCIILLRRTLSHDVALLGGKVSLMEDKEKYWALWAKADKNTYQVHRLIYHLLDVGNCALVLWQYGINKPTKEQIAGWLHLDASHAGNYIAFLAALHDLGKASPAFQDHPNLPSGLREKIRTQINIAGLEIPARSDLDKRARHEVISTYSLNNEASLNCGQSMSSLRDLFAQVIGGHHGAWPQVGLFSPIHLKSLDKGNEGWTNVRQEIYNELFEIFHPSAIPDVKLNTLKDNSILTIISGLISIADWLGSANEYFNYEPRTLTIEQYFQESRTKALNAIKRIEWDSPPELKKFEFQNIFGFTPRKSQQQISEVLEKIALPALAIIEAPMGSGKTEAAMAVYANWIKASGYSGLYIAMPTTATSNQMHSRISDFLSKLFGIKIEPLLVHSQALLRGVPKESDEVEEQNEGEQASIQSWFLPRKKSLLSTFGVGTVDQALMSVLQTKHFFVRLFGLSNKVVIFDEVHAYDAYMSVLFERLLTWLRQINTSVIILSATLPEKTRKRLIHAYTDGNGSIPPAQYPRLTFALPDRQINAVELDPPNSKILQFEYVNQDNESIIQILSERLQEGGCAVVICNTVHRAQALYKLLNETPCKLCDDENLILFHARFPLAWREELEQTVLSKFGPGKDKDKPNPNRPMKAIVIATQVIEQSLDLDFDIMISDMAPVDLLLQRAGRLHRHSVNTDIRKQSYTLFIAVPERETGIPKFERGDTYVYDEYILLRSWIALQNIKDKQIILPDDLPELIQQVYGDDKLTFKSVESNLLARLSKTKHQMKTNQIEAEDSAGERLIGKPSFRRLLYQPNLGLEEDNVKVHKAFRALTRDGNPGIQVICLHFKDNNLYLEEKEDESIYHINEKPNNKVVRELLRHSININHPDPKIEEYLLTNLNDPYVKQILTIWKLISALRFHRVVIFDNGFCLLHGTGYIISLNKEDKLGLKIYKED